jgi:hypothetical protein
MRICLINYAHETARKVGILEMQQRQIEQAYNNGVDKVIPFGRKNIIDSPLYSAHKDLLDETRGAGYWLWKPYLILKAMTETNLSYDVYVYLDADIEIKSSIEPFALLTRKQAVAGIRTTYQHARFCKRDCSIAFNSENDDYTKWYQLHAGVIAFGYTHRAILFLTDWLAACCNHHLINDEPSVAENYPFFLEHRHDQALYTLIYHKYDFPIYQPSTLAFTDLYPLREWCETEVEGEYSN